MAQLPEQKAKTLVTEFYSKVSGIDLMHIVGCNFLLMSEDNHVKRAKQCALIAVDEIIESYRLNVSLGWTGAIHENNIEYYQKVKEEINQQ